MKSYKRIYVWGDGHVMKCVTAGRTDMIPKSQKSTEYMRADIAREQITRAEMKGFQEGVYMARKIMFNLIGDALDELTNRSPQDGRPRK